MSITLTRTNKVTIAINAGTVIPSFSALSTITGFGSINALHALAGYLDPAQRALNTASGVKSPLKVLLFTTTLG
jgi:hypothetical protein